MAEYTYHEATAHEATDLPVMLPGKLIGRDQMLATVYGDLKQNKPVHLYGLPGIGKTAIAATLASAYTQQTGGALWLSVDGDSLAQMITRVGRAYNDMDLANSESPTGMIGAVTTLLAQHKPLIVLDGNPTPAATREFISQVAANLPVMIVSDNLGDYDYTTVEVDALATRDAATLFSEKSGLNTPEVTQIVELLGNHPLSLLIAAGTARIAKMDGAQLLKALQGAAETDPGRRALKVGFASLQQGLQGILLMIGATFEGKASLELLTMLSGAPTETVQKVMTILAASGFVQQDIRYGSPYYYMHPTVHNYSQNFLQQSQRLQPLQEKVRDVVLDYSQKYANADEDAHSKLALEMDSFLATAHWASEQGDLDVSSQIVAALTQAGDFVKGRGYLQELLQLQDTGSSGMSAFPANATLPPEALELDDADADLDDEEEDFFDDFLIEDEEEDEEVGLGTSLGLGSPEDFMIGAAPTVTVDMSDPESIRAAIVEARRNEDTDREQSLQESLAKLLVSQGNQNEALAVYNELLNSYEASDDKQKIMDTQLALARIMVKLENSQAAVLQATQGSKLAEELNDEAKHAQFLMQLGDARQQLGESKEAILAYSKVIELTGKLDDEDLAATAQMQLGFAQLDDDDPEIAIKTWEDALKWCKDLGKRDCEGRILGGLGTAYGELSRWEEAINYHNSALYIAREVSDKKEEALQLSNLGYAAKEANKLADAVLRYRQALHLAYTNDERENIVSTIVDLARLLSTSKLHLDIADMLVNDALVRDPSDREVLDLKQKITSERMMAVAQDVQMKPVGGTAQEYAEAAYTLLDG
jgi:tetratricopeptide (TPR) repeat protein